MKLAAAIAILAFAALPVTAARAQDYPPFLGFAAAQAPEAGLGTCHGTDPVRTITCAQNACMKERGLGLADCTANLWCYPAFWVADIAVLSAEGPHWHEFICNENQQFRIRIKID